MQAVIKSGGKQYTVNEGDEICVELLNAEVGTEVSFPEILMVCGDSTKVGTPVVEGASVKGQIVDAVKGPKTRCVFFRRRKDSRTVKGHRQQLHKVKITAISA